jgi:hypothetical protein
MEMTRGPSSDERLIELLEPLLVTVDRPYGLCQYSSSAAVLRANHIHAVALERLDAGSLGVSGRADWERRRTVCSCLVCHVLGRRRGWRG